MSIPQEFENESPEVWGLVRDVYNELSPPEPENDSGTKEIFSYENVTGKQKLHIQKAKQLAGKDCVKDRLFCIEAQHYRSNQKDNIPTRFGYHRDDYNVRDDYGGDYGLEETEWMTVIFYIEKSPGIKGGDFKYMLGRKIHTVTVKSEKIIVFRGDLLHKPECVSGEGIRKSIVVFLERRDT